MKQVDLVILAGGVGERIGLDTPKQYLSAGSSVPVVVRALQCFELCPWIRRRIIVLKDKDNWIDACKSHIQSSAVTFVNGGATRWASLEAGLSEVYEPEMDNQWVMTHDASRCFLTKEELDRLEYAIFNIQADGYTLGLPIYDALCHAQDGYYTSPIDRQSLYRTLTPQIFKASHLQAMCNHSMRELYSDETGIATQELGLKVRHVMGSEENIKITVPEHLKKLS